MDTLKVRDAKDVEQVVRAAIASEQPLEIVGHGSKRLVGQPMATNALLELSALNAVTAYEPNELIITVQAGAPLADVQSLIDSRNQQFAFEPIDTVGAARRIRRRHHRRHDRGRPGRSAPHQGRRRPRSPSGGACGVRLRRQLQNRRAGGEERHRLRSLQIAGGLVGHARGHDRSDPEGDAEARKRTHAGAARARRSHRQPGDDGRARLAVRRLRRGASAEFGVPARGRRPGRASARRGRRSPCCGSKALRRRSRTAPTRSARSLAPFGAVEILQDAISAAIWASIRDVQPFAAAGALGGVAGVADRLSAGLGRRARPGAWRAIPGAT